MAIDLDAAIGAHTQWKIKLRTAINRKEQLDAATISKDNCCELGKWIYGEGRQSLGTKPEFTAMLEKHKVFHGEAGKVATAINAGKYTDASTMISGDSPFGTASSSVVIAIGVLKSLV
jgi:hypothetical protein